MLKCSTVHTRTIEQLTFVAKNLKQCEHSGPNVVKMEAARILPDPGSQEGGVLLPLPQRQVHLGHKQLGKVHTAALAAIAHCDVITGGKLHAEEVHTKVGKDEHEDDEHDGHEEDLFEAAAELGDHFAHVRHQDEYPVGRQPLTWRKNFNCKKVPELPPSISFSVEKG